MRAAEDHLHSGMGEPALSAFSRPRGTAEGLWRSSPTPASVARAAARYADLLPHSAAPLGDAELAESGAGLLDILTSLEQGRRGEPLPFPAPAPQPPLNDEVFVVDSDDGPDGSPRRPDGASAGHKRPRAGSGHGQGDPFLPPPSHGGHRKSRHSPSSGHRKRSSAGAPGRALSPASHESPPHLDDMSEDEEEESVTSETVSDKSSHVGDTSGGSSSASTGSSPRRPSRTAPAASSRPAATIQPLAAPLARLPADAAEETLRGLLATHARGDVAAHPASSIRDSASTWAYQPSPLPLPLHPSVPLPASTSASAILAARRHPDGLAAGVVDLPLAGGPPGLATGQPPAQWVADEMPARRPPHAPAPAGPTPTRSPAPDWPPLPVPPQPSPAAAPAPPPRAPQPPTAMTAPSSALVPVPRPEAPRDRSVSSGRRSRKRRRGSRRRHSRDGQDSDGEARERKRGKKERREKKRREKERAKEKEEKQKAKERERAEQEREKAQRAKDREKERERERREAAGRREPTRQNGPPPPVRPATAAAVVPVRPSPPAPAPVRPLADRQPPVPGDDDDVGGEDVQRISRMVLEAVRDMKQEMRTVREDSQERYLKALVAEAIKRDRLQGGPAAAPPTEMAHAGAKEPPAPYDGRYDGLGRPDGCPPPRWAREAPPPAGFGPAPYPPGQPPYADYRGAAEPPPDFGPEPAGYPQRWAPYPQRGPPGPPEFGGPPPDALPPGTGRDDRAVRGKWDPEQRRGPRPGWPPRDEPPPGDAYPPPWRQPEYPPEGGPYRPTPHHMGPPAGYAPEPPHPYGTGGPEAGPPPAGPYHRHLQQLLEQHLVSQRDLPAPRPGPSPSPGRYPPHRPPSPAPHPHHPGHSLPRRSPSPPPRAPHGHPHGRGGPPPARHGRPASQSPPPPRPPSTRGRRSPPRGPRPSHGRSPTPPPRSPPRGGRGEWRGKGGGPGPREYERRPPRQFDRDEYERRGGSPDRRGSADRRGSPDRRGPPPRRESRGRGSPPRRDRDHHGDRGSHRPPPRGRYADSRSPPRDDGRSYRKPYKGGDYGGSGGADKSSCWFGYFTAEPTLDDLQRGFDALDRDPVVKVNWIRGHQDFTGCGYVVFRNAELASRAMEQRQWRINGDDITVKPCSDVRITRNLTANRFETIRDELPEGLHYVRDFLTEAEEKDLLLDIDDNAAWEQTAGRRTEQFGAIFNYSTQKLDPAAPPNDRMPKWIGFVLQRLVEKYNDIFPCKPDQLIINEYGPDQGLGLHVDKPELFDRHIATISLGSVACMALKPTRGRDDEEVGLLLEPRSLLILSGAARYKWRHGIARDRVVQIKSGVRVDRSRRVSLTLRRILADARERMEKEA